ncbi:MAG: hypothetical protein SGARI_000991, partial [Bacillariaceae sp.]
MSPKGFESPVSDSGEKEAAAFYYNLLADGDDGGDSAKILAASARGAWLEAFWISTQQRKHPAYAFAMENDDKTMLMIRKKEVCGARGDEKATSDVYWNKMLQKDLKKIHVEDLGDLAAQELWATIPDEDKEERGRKDLQRLEQQLSVKV